MTTTSDAWTGSRVRPAVAWVLGVLAVLALSLTTVALWARATVLRSDRVGVLVGDALAEPEVQTALADYVAREVVDAVDVEAVVRETLPSPLSRLAPTIAAGAESALREVTATTLRRPETQDALVELVERAHARLVDLLRGDGAIDGVTVADGAVTLNLLPLVGRSLEALQDLGLLADVEIPELTVAGDPAAQIAELSTALDRELPADFAQLVVYESDSVSSAQESVRTAQRLLALAERAVVLIVLAGLLLAAATVVVAPDRWRAALVLGAGTAVAMVVVRTVAHRVVDEAPDLVEQPGAKAAVEAVVGGAGSSLLRLSAFVLLLAVAAVAVALLHRRWPRRDLVLVAAFAAAALTVATLGVSVLGLLLAIAAAVAVPFVALRLDRRAASD